ncbi:MAG: alpha/beta hydrolase, partial [Saprospiraceae bacterium]|nr:alpha/beta hydrolase [Saprospiraceae bacterium]
PALIITGALDVKDIHRIALIYNTKLQNSKLIEFDSAAHTINMEMPTQFNETVISFLSDNRGPDVK